MVGRNVIEKEAKIQRAGSDWNQKNSESGLNTWRGSSLKACCAPPENVFNDMKPGKDQCDEADLCN